MHACSKDKASKRFSCWASLPKVFIKRNSALLKFKCKILTLKNKNHLTAVVFFDRRTSGSLYGKRTTPEYSRWKDAALAFH